MHNSEAAAALFLVSNHQDLLGISLPFAIKDKVRKGFHYSVCHISRFLTYKYYRGIYF